MLRRFYPKRPGVSAGVASLAVSPLLIGAFHATSKDVCWNHAWGLMHATGYPAFQEWYLGVFFGLMCAVVVVLQYWKYYGALAVNIGAIVLGLWIAFGMRLVSHHNHGSPGTKCNLGAIRSALAIYYGDRRGSIPLRSRRSPKMGDI